MQVVKEYFASTVSYFHIGLSTYINETFIPQLISFKNEWFVSQTALHELKRMPKSMLFFVCSVHLPKVGSEQFCSNVSVKRESTVS